MFMGSGLTYAGWAYFNYDLGTLRRVGPGLFPVGLGTILAVIGVFLAVPAMRGMRLQPTVPSVSTEAGPSHENATPNTFRAGIFVLASLIAFALVLPNFGAIPAIFALTYTAVLAEPGRDYRTTPALIAALLSAFVWLLFKQALSLPLTMLKWPF
nr:tripartite tricarboxylate transporter TctB family protein [Devosia sp. MC532]